MRRIIKENTYPYLFEEGQPMIADETKINMISEILIIGGGITGTSTANYLAQSGHEVILLERNEIASEASGLNAGTVANRLGHTTRSIIYA